MISSQSQLNGGAGGGGGGGGSELKHLQAHSLQDSDEQNALQLSGFEAVL